MSETHIVFLGSGDAFGSGGRFQTCIYVDVGNTRFLIDCGASSLIAMKRFGIDPSSINCILITHLHGDHFGGIPFIIRETQITPNRANTLIIAGPQGIEKRVRDAMEILFPGSARMQMTFPLEFIELSDEQPNAIGSLVVRSYRAVHTGGTEPHSLRVECNGKTISYSGDTEWNDNLIKAAQEADLFVCESFFYEREVKNHLSYRTLMSHRNELTCGRLVLTHMSEDMLSKLKDIDIEWAEDGKRIDL